MLCFRPLIFGSMGILGYEVPALVSACSMLLVDKKFGESSA